jgi:hypothetical protein
MWVLQKWPNTKERARPKNNGHLSMVNGQWSLKTGPEG